jgi:hypothetical protein
VYTAEKLREPGVHVPGAAHRLWRLCGYLERQSELRRVRQYLPEPNVLLEWDLRVPEQQRTAWH